MTKAKNTNWIELISEISGWYGAVAVILAFGLLTAGIFDSKNIIYLLLNLTGSIGIMFDAFMDKNIQPVVINVVWIIIALYGILQVIIS